MKRPYKLIATFTAVVTIVVSSFYFTDAIADSETVGRLVDSLGYIAVLVTAFIANINVFVPVPPGIFAPIFLAAGLELVFIILFITIGTLIADLVGYLIGFLSRDAVKNTYPHIHARVHEIATTRQHLLIPGIIFYSAFVPFPNEAIVIPLGMLNYPVRKLLIPMMIGSSIHHTIIVLGAVNAQTLLF